ncbi:ATP-grasp domain-containing protein [Thiolinea disciformis]|uniref:ATP-grasp domain-containing protein n=1 Tax=Thiolinea disciformis TaxID=125614 RepID=UPI00036C7B70|nr:ATP-grasp domain-containing protein [Thiolinea disciformis]
MHYVIQQSIYKPQNLQILLEVLERLALPYDLVKANADLSLEPEVNPQGKVFVFGAWRMAAIAQQRQWSPASFLNENFDYVVWQLQLGSQLLNANAQVLKFKEIHDLQRRYFIRPTQDTKAFDGAVFDADKVKALQSMTIKAYLLSTYLKEIAY